MYKSVFVLMANEARVGQMAELFSVVNSTHSFGTLGSIESAWELLAATTISFILHEY